MEGNVFNINTNTPLTTHFLSCDYVDGGEISFRKNLMEATIDFGDGSYDDLVVITYPDGAIEEVRLND